MDHLGEVYLYTAHKASNRGLFHMATKLSEDTAQWHRALQELEKGRTGLNLGLAEGGLAAS